MSIITINANCFCRKDEIREGDRNTGEGREEKAESHFSMSARKYVSIFIVRARGWRLTGRLSTCSRQLEFFKCVCVSIYAGVKEGLLSVLSTERES